MAVRLEVNMKVADKTWEVDFNEETRLLELTLDGQPTQTPKGNPVAHCDPRLLYHIMAELRCLKTLEPKLCTLWLFGSIVDHKKELLDAFGREEIRNLLFRDPVLACSASPDCAMAQKDDWMALEVFLSQNGITYPDLPQAGDPEEYLKECGTDAQANFDKLVDQLTGDVSKFSIAQRVVLANAINSHQSLTQAFFLATKRVTPLEYATGIAAANCILPWAFGDIRLKDYTKGLQEIVLEALMMRTFEELYMSA